MSLDYKIFESHLIKSDANLLLVYLNCARILYQENFQFGVCKLESNGDKTRLLDMYDLGIQLVDMILNRAHVLKKLFP